LQLKWPNDIYIESNGLYKVGGILVTSEYQHGIGFVVTVGCGLNVFNQKPARCISEFMNDPTKLSLELALAKILTRFESIYEEFCEYNEAGCQNPFEIFQDRYHACWMHGNQRVVVDSQKGPIECIINGISSSGLLKAIPVRGGEELLLQPDGNSFDMLKGLISAKKT
jgi:biotin--protein ligase